MGSAAKLPNENRLEFLSAMKQIILISFVAAIAAAALAQTAPKPAARSSSARSAAVPTASSRVKLPPGVPPSHAVVKTAFSLRYQDIRIGTGAEAEPNKMCKVQYTGWLASDGHKFDSSYDHKMPVLDKDGKPELDADGKPKMGEAQPLTFAQGFGRVIPGFDQGFTGMKIGGKRRLFIPWQLAYGARGRPGPSAENPGIPPKADLIFDIELVDQSDLDMQMPQGHPGMGQPMHGVPHMPAGSSKPSDRATPPPTGSPANPGSPSPAGTPPPSTPPPTTPPAEKPQ
jgi:peptidylprolyl isomerase